MIVGIGIDLVEISRIRESLDRFGARFKNRIFSQVEQEYCDRMKDPALHYAARFAAKEAAFKALGTGLAQGVKWTEAAVRNLPSGQPVLEVTGRAAEIAAVHGAVRWHVSLSHHKQQAGAVAVLERE